MKKKRIIAVMMTGTVAVSALLAGTYAWRSMNQQAKNEVLAQANPGGRLHDDFTGLRWNSTDANLKNVYVENFTEKTGGAKIYARIRLDEYLELGSGAGKADGTEGKTAKPIVTTNPDNKKSLKIGDRSTWVTYKWDDESDFRDYVTLNTGGKTTYLPTYNKNKDSLDADVNGTLEGTDGSKDTLLDAYEDYVDYSDGAAHSSLEIYDEDGDDYDEIGNAELTTKQIIEAFWDAEEQELKTMLYIAGTKVTVGTVEATITDVKSANGKVKTIYLDLDDDNPPEGSSADGADIRIEVIDSEDYHSGQPTLEAEFVSMADWLSPSGKNKAAGNYWVYDTEDGWVYWANPIEPQTATGCLINSITCANQELMAGEYYYGLNVVAQFATAGDWGQAAGEGTEAEGFYIDKISENALTLLNTIAAKEAQTQ